MKPWLYKCLNHEQIGLYCLVCVIFQGGLLDLNSVPCAVQVPLCYRSRLSSFRVHASSRGSGIRCYTVMFTGINVILVFKNQTTTTTMWLYTSDTGFRLHPFIINETLTFDLQKIVSVYLWISEIFVS